MKTPAPPFTTDLKQRARELCAMGAVSNPEWRALVSELVTALEREQNARAETDRFNLNSGRVVGTFFRQLREEAFALKLNDLDLTAIEQHILLRYIFECFRDAAKQCEHASMAQFAEMEIDHA